MLTINKPFPVKKASTYSTLILAIGMFGTFSLLVANTPNPTQVLAKSPDASYGKQNTSSSEVSLAGASINTAPEQSNWQTDGTDTSAWVPSTPLSSRVNSSQTSTPSSTATVTPATPVIEQPQPTVPTPEVPVVPPVEPEVPVTPPVTDPTEPIIVTPLIDVSINL